jgi:hypothetical protein
MQQFFKKNVQPIAMLEVHVGHHSQWNMMVSNVGYAREALLTGHLITPPNLHMFFENPSNSHPFVMKIKHYQCE